MPEIFFYSLFSVLIVSLISLVGVFALLISASKLNRFLIYLISFSAGALFGDVFIHLLPGTVEQFGFGAGISVYILIGIAIFFILEKFIHWQHCHVPIDKNHIHPFVYTNLVGDGLHNFIDGVIIAVSYIVSFPVGLATTIAVILHEIPQEIGDFGILIHGGFTKTKALLFNFVSALFAVLGAFLVFIIEDFVKNVELFLVPVAAGGFIYIAGSDLIPELHKHSDKLKKSFLQLLAFVFGILVMVLLLFLE